jgi:hypothetical protein
MKILYWSEDYKPQDLVRTDVSLAKREAVAEILAKGKVMARYRGRARCRICHKLLGSCDLGRYGFSWPQGAEHYVIKHGVWVDEFEDLIEEAA